MAPSTRALGPLQVAVDISPAAWALDLAWALAVGLATREMAGVREAAGAAAAALVVGGVAFGLLRDRYHWLHRRGPWRLLRHRAAQRRLVDALAECRTERSIAWITVWHDEERVTVRRLATVFEAAGWQTQWSDLPQAQVVHADHDEQGIAVHGHDRHLVETVGEILARQMRGVYTRVEPSDIERASRTEKNKVRITVYREPSS